MKPKIRILTYHYIPNNGAFLFAYSLQKGLQSELSGADVQILNYKSTRLAFIEYLKQLNVFQSIPSFYFERSHMWRRFITGHLELDDDLPRLASTTKLQRIFSDRYDALIVGMDVWCIIRGTQRPSFPNIYWLPQKLSIPKLAYGVSAYYSDLSLIKQHKQLISTYLNDFEIIGVRDQFTYELVCEHRSRTDGLVSKIPDPAFLYEIQPTSIAKKLASLGIDLDRPMVGVLLYGSDKLAQEIQSHFRAKGYQIIALSMFNPYADFNLGHKLNPFEWAEAFQLLSFCVTDRFHGTIFCLKNQIPFISIEKESDLPQNQSKLYDLLAEFDMTACYQNPYDDKFNIYALLHLADEIQKSWNGDHKPKIAPKIQDIIGKHCSFINQIKAEFSLV